MTAPEVLAIRLQLRLSQSELARACGLLGRHASRRVRGWEEGLYSPSRRVVARLLELARTAEGDPGVAGDRGG
jgi:transcriptional regulator with XRE-family HTH domain